MYWINQKIFAMLSKEAFEKLPIFIISMSRWDGDVSSASLSMAKVLSRTNPVYYIDYPYTWADMWRERKSLAVKRRLPALLSGKNYLTQIPGQSVNLQAATPKAVIPYYSIPAGKLHDYVINYNNHRLADLIEKIRKEKGIKDYIFINSFNPYYLSEVGKFLSPTLSIYHSRDAIEEVNDVGLIRENECVQNYEMAMATSKQLCRNISQRNNKVVNYFPNGGDTRLFRKAITEKLAKPKELESISTPVIGYTGAVCQRVDYELLVKIANENKDKTLVLVGPRKDKNFTDINLDTIPNIVLTGPKKIDELPAYLQHFDCLIIPFVKNNLTGGIYPLKINEYLGAGKAVISTNFSEDIATFRDSIYLADSHEEFLRMIPAAMKNNSRELQEERFLVADSNSWERRAELFWNLAWNAYQEKAQTPVNS
jgi:hypothetical protein